MDKYIRKSDIGLTDFEIISCQGDYKQALQILLDKIDTLPLINVKPVIKGTWLFDDFDGDGFDYQCSNCKRYSRRNYNYCPNCGAQMEGIKSNDESRTA